MRKLFYLKALMLSLCMAVSFVLPVNAQRNDNFIGWEDNNTMRDPIATWITTNGITNQDFNDTPLGSGLLIMVTAGAGYAVARRRRNKGVKVVNGFKGFNAIIIAFALLLGMTQCKKKDILPTTSNAPQITLNIDNNSKYIVNPPHVTFENKDAIAVGYKGNYVGVLTHNGTCFTGTVTLPTTPEVGDEDEPLYFYFLGIIAQGFGGNFDEGTTPSIPFCITDQASLKLPILSCGQSNTPYSGSGSYSSKLYNKCALVKFVLTNETESNSITINGVSDAVVADFANHTISETTLGYATNTIIAKKESSTVFWAVLLPNASEVPTTATIDGNNYDVTIPALAANDYVTIEIDNSGSTPTPSGDYYFSVGENTKVVFSLGNLQYKYYYGWQFAEHQYTYQTTWPSYSPGNIFDLFGWGTWGTNANLPVLSTGTDDEDYDPWTEFNSTIELDNQTGWRTLSSSEWAYLLSNEGYRENKYGAAKVNGVSGLVILPDNWVKPSEISFTAGIDAYGEFHNTYTADQWNNVMQPAGAIFLPAMCFRGSTNNTTIVNNTSANAGGSYWSSSKVNNNNQEAKCLELILNEGMDFTLIKERTQAKHFGFYVRLVRDYTPSSK